MFGSKKLLDGCLSWTDSRLWIVAVALLMKYMDSGLFSLRYAAYTVCEYFFVLFYLRGSSGCTLKSGPRHDLALPQNRDSQNWCPHEGAHPFVFFWLPFQMANNRASEFPTPATLRTSKRKAWAKVTGVVPQVEPVH